MSAAELLARVWWVGVATTPWLLLVAARSRARHRHPGRQHAATVAVLVGLAVSSAIPALAEPGPVLAAARRDFRAAGLAPCRAQLSGAAREPALPPASGEAVPGPEKCWTYAWGPTWGAVAGLLLAWQALGVAWVWHQRRLGATAPARWRREVRAAAAVSGTREPRLVMTRGWRGRTPAAGPMVAGVLRPTLLLPADLWDRLDATARQAILRHELAHVRRRDPLTKALVRAAAALFWWHPAVWCLCRNADRAAELAADRRAVRGDPRRAAALARALVEVHRLGMVTRGWGAGAASAALSPAGRELAERLRALLGDRSGRDDDSRRWVMGCWLGFVVITGGTAVQIAMG
ncbi:MAG: M56 family metallopeptidase [Planctomycetota bacterium]